MSYPPHSHQFHVSIILASKYTSVAQGIERRTPGPMSLTVNHQNPECSN